MSMYTRASSIRSNYTTSSSKSKIMIPQRISGNGSLQHYNALHLTDTVASMKNNNIVNGNCVGTIANVNWSSKSSPWLLNQMPTTTNGSMVEWQDKKNIMYCKANHLANCTTTKIPNASSKNVLYEPICTQTKMCDSSDISHNCCCQSLRKNLSKSNLNDNELRATISTLPEDDDDDCGGDEGDEDFRKSIIRINNMYNSCRDVNSSSRSMDNEKFLLMNNTRLTEQRVTHKIDNDVNL